MHKTFTEESPVKNFGGNLKLDQVADDGTEYLNDKFESAVKTE